MTGIDTSTERVRQLAEGIRLSPVQNRWIGDVAVRTFLTLADERDELDGALRAVRDRINARAEPPAEFLARLGFAFVSINDDGLVAAAPDDELADDWIADQVRTGYVVMPLPEIRGVSPIPVSMTASEIEAGWPGCETKESS